MPLRTLLAAIALAVCTAGAEPHDPAKIREATTAVTRNVGAQSRLPNSAGTPAAPAKRSADGWSLGGSGGSPVAAPAAVFSLFEWVLIAVAAVALVALLAVLLREPIEARFRPAASRGGPERVLPPPPADPGELLARADELAAAGRYAEAMHCLLLSAMAMLAGDKPRQSADSLTSWELLRAAPLAPPRLQPLHDLVVRVERAWFGQRPAGLEDYRQVRGSFDEFASTARETA